MAGYTCKSCSESLKYAFEIEQGLLCSLCGPGSEKWQREAKVAKEEEMRQQIRLAVEAERGSIEAKVRKEAEDARHLLKEQIRAEVKAEEEKKRLETHS